MNAVKEQYPDKELIACMELHTFSSLQENFLPQYKGCMDNADAAFVYFSPEVVAHKRLQPITAEQVKEAFGKENLHVFTDADELQRALRSMSYHGKALLMMSSGNFSGLDVSAFARELLEA